MLASLGGYAGLEVAGELAAAKIHGPATIALEQLASGRGAPDFTTSIFIGRFSLF